MAKVVLKPVRQAVLPALQFWQGSTDIHHGSALLCFGPSVDHGTWNRPLCDNMKHIATILVCGVQRQSSHSFLFLCPALS